MRLNGNLVPDVLSSIKLLCFSCTCTYVPNSTLQCLSYVFFCPVNIVLGPIVACTPSLCRKLFSQNTQLYTISTISHREYLSTVRVVAIFLTLILLPLFISQSLVHAHWWHICSLICPCLQLVSECV